MSNFVSKIGSDNHCCAEVIINSNKEAKSKHANRLGVFVKFGNSNDKRFSYRQKNGESYLYWQKGVWMVRKYFT